MGREKMRVNLPPILSEDQGRCLEQQEIAQRLGISRARVSFLERSALRKLKALAKKRGWG